MSDGIRYERHGHVACITLDRPARRNALDRAAAAELARVWRAFEAGEERVAVVTGAGTEAFCSGIDVADPPEPWTCLPGAGVDVSKPVIAAVSGWAAGFGVALTMAADIAVAARGARFLYPEAKLGYTGGLVASLAVRIAHKHAMEIMLLGEPFDADKALAIGLVNRVTDEGRHLDEAMAIADRIAGHAPLVVRTLKRLALATLPRSPAETSAALRGTLAAIERSSDRQEGEKAFREKRPARFTGD